MPVYEYLAVDASGLNTSGNIPAPNRSAALNELSHKGLIPVKVLEQPAVIRSEVVQSSGGGHVSAVAAEAFTRFATNRPCASRNLLLPLLAFGPGLYPSFVFIQKIIAIIRGTRLRG